MAKQVREVDIVCERRPTLWFARILGHDEIAAVAQSRDDAIYRVLKLAARVLRREIDRLEDQVDKPDAVVRHIKLSIPASTLGRLITLDLNLCAICYTNDEGTTVHLPQLSAELFVKDLAQLEMMCAEWLRDRYPLEGRLPDLLVCVPPLVIELAAEEPHRRFTVQRQRVKFRPDPVTAADDETDSAPTLSAVGEPLHRTMARRDTPRAFERRAEVDALLTALSDSAERSTLLVGAAGVGKTAIVREAVRRIVNENAPDVLHGLGVWQVSGGRLMAGMRYLGQWQERVIEVIEDAREVGAVLFAPNLMELLETAGTDKHAEGIPGMLLPHILSGDLVFVTEAQPEQIARAEQTHPSFLRALRRIPVDPLSPAATDEVLHRVSFRLGRQFGVRLAAETRQTILSLVSRFSGGGELPGPAVELAERIARTHRTRGVADEDEDRPLMQPEHAVEAFASLTGLPTKLLDPDVAFTVTEVSEFFGGQIYAQPEAVSSMVELVTCIRAGLNAADRPLGSYLFLGPTGVGKTQTALTLAEYLFGSSSRLVRLDMSEYQDPWAAGRLVGRYRGERGELVRRVKEQPFLVLLLDEIEKAHASVFDFLLQVLGEGRLTDGLGQTVSFSSSVVIMTSNLGAGGPPSLGFTPGKASDGRAAEVAHYLGAVEKFFRPEFVGRIDKVIPFRALGMETARQLVERALQQAFARDGLTRRNIRARATDNVVDFLIERGFDDRYGARPLRRAVENFVTSPLAQFLSREAGLVDIGVVVDIDGGVPTIDIE